jgi:hypothetical protein
MTITLENDFISLIFDIQAAEDSLIKPFTLMPMYSAASSSSVLAFAEKSTGIEKTASSKLKCSPFVRQCGIIEMYQEKV